MGAVTVPLTPPAASVDAVPARPRRRIPAGTKVDYWLDAALLVAFVLDESFRFTGLSVHEWIGLGFGVALLVHLTLHWEWVLRTTRRLVGSLPGRERVRWIVDLLLLVAMTMCVASGVLISRSALPAIGYRPLGGAFWSGLHSATADLSVLFVGVHLALGWQWIVTVSRRMFGRSGSRQKSAS